MSRPLLLAAIFIFCSAVSRADVVVENGTAGGTFSAFVDTYKIFFKTGASSQWKIDSIKLFGNTPGIAIGVGLSFQLKNESGTNLGSSDNFAAELTFDPNKELVLNLTNVSQNTLTADTTYQLHVFYGLVVATQADGNGAYSYPSGGFSNAVMKNGSDQIINGFQFQMVGTAVPEPPTLILGFLSTAMGCAIYWVMGSRPKQENGALA